MVFLNADIISSMRVAIDSGSKSSVLPTGVGVVTAMQIKALGAEARKIKNFQVDVFDFSENSEKLLDGKYDVVHYPYFHPFFVTLPPSILLRVSQGKFPRTVVTIHDVIPLIYPKYYPPGIKGKMRFLEQKRRLKDIDGVITVSETSKKDIVRFLNLPAAKIHAIYNAPLPFFRKEDDRNKLNEVARKYKLPNKFVLYLGDVYYSKNIPNLVRACKIAGLPLVIVGKQAKDIENNLDTNLEKLKGPQDWMRFLLGKPHPEQAHYRMVNELFDKVGVLRLGYIPDADLVSIYNLATVYCQPSLYEGFGLGVVHAFACGAPTVISKTQALVEIADKAALIADPRDPKDIALKIRMLFEDFSQRVELINRGFERVKNFSWEKNAKETIKVYKNLVISV